MTGDDHVVTTVHGLDVSEVEDGLIVISAGGTEIVHLNGAAALIFELCDGTRTVEQIVTAVRAEVPEGGLGAVEVSECIDRFRSEGLVEGHSSP